MPIIDAHIHIFPPEVVAARERFCNLDSYFSELYKNPKARLATADDAILSLDRNGVDAAFALGFGWRDLTLCRLQNDYLIDVQARYSGRLIGFAATQPLNGEPALVEVERALGRGLRGIGELMPHGQGYQLDDWAVLDPLACLAAEAGVPLVSHVSEPLGHLYPGKGDVSPIAAWRFAARHPRLKVIFAHWGGGLPFYELMPEVAESLRNVSYDSAASTFLYKDAVFKIVAELCGPERIIFGTDFPLLRQGPFLQKIRALGLPEKSLRLILGGNAAKLMGGLIPNDQKD